MSRPFPRLLLFAAFVLLLAAPLCAPSAFAASKTVTLESLLLEMVNRDDMAKMPVPAYTLKQSSSHDVSKRDPADASTWHSNHDSEQFLRTELHEGRREWVIMDDKGPGAITRFWLPLLAEHDNQVIRFYLDGSDKPAITAKFNDLLSGRAFVPPPFAFVAWNDTDMARHQKDAAPATLRGVAGDLYLPIPFARRCKITLDQIPFYYIINYRAYASGTSVKTFTMDEFKAAGNVMERVSRLLTALPAPVAKPLTAQATVGPGDVLAQTLEHGTYAVRELQVEIDPNASPNALRSTILEMTFDEEPTVWCPLSEFFGTMPRVRPNLEGKLVIMGKEQKPVPSRVHPVQDWNRTATEDGKFTARWVMPYQHSGRISLRNLGDKPVAMKLSTSIGPWHWDERSLYFHANWHGESNIKTRPYADWNYIDIQGQGQYVGDTLSVFTPAGEWYGEGDERVYVDGETFPSHIGTGTEDYYGYAWGMASYFNAPFLSTPLRDTPDRDDWHGYTTTSRLRLLDAIPMQTGLKLDMEIWNWADTSVDYAVGTFWYARPGAQHNRPPQPREAVIPVRLFPITFTVLVPGAIECETLPIAAKSPDVQTSVQSGGLSQGSWSNGKQLFVQASKVGDYVDLEIPAPDNQPRKVTLYGTKSFDYAQLRFRLNGDMAGDVYDAFAPTPILSGPVEVGVATPKDGKLLLRVEVAGANPAAKGKKTYFGLDYVLLTKP